MNKYIKYFLAPVFVAIALQSFGQFNKGRKAIGGEFSFLNSRNDQSSGNFSFAESKNTGFSFTLTGGEFVRDNLFLYGIAGINYSKSSRNSEFKFGGQDVSRQLSIVTTPALGVGVRRYMPATERMGFFVQLQTTFSASYLRSDNFWMDNDTVVNDNKIKYPFYSLNVNVNPGVYLNLGQRWQLTFDLGNLYFVQTWQPEKKGVVEKRRNATFGLDVNLFDFKVGAVYFLGKME